MVGASCFLPTWQWAHMETLKASHFHVNIRTRAHTSGPNASSWIFMGSLSHLPQGRQASPVMPPQPPWAAVWVTHLHHLPTNATYC